MSQPINSIQRVYIVLVLRDKTFLLYTRFPFSVNRYIYWSPLSPNLFTHICQVCWWLVRIFKKLQTGWGHEDGNIRTPSCGHRHTHRAPTSKDAQSPGVDVLSIDSYLHTSHIYWLCWLTDFHMSTESEKKESHVAMVRWESAVKFSVDQTVRGFIIQVSWPKLYATEFWKCVFVFNVYRAL